MTRAIRPRYLTLAVALIATSVLLACGSGGTAIGLGSPSASPTNTATPVPIVVVTLTPTPTATAVPQPTSLHVETTPPGAQMEVGLQLVNNIVTPGTGRMVGVTPLTIELRQSDISRLNDTTSDIYWMTQLPGYVPCGSFIELTTGAPLEPGMTYSSHCTLTPIH
jgi:hypothetical protein